ncbi:MAG: bifunctional glutamate N-acetyltransferase/amino-acid acetyltransferase ArgJ [Gloeomargarita sp. DG_2_bins_126]
MWRAIAGGVTAPQGYRAGAVSAGLKPSGALDLTLIYSETPAVAAGALTTSQVRAACVTYCQEQLQAGHPIRAIVCNAGQANAATGRQGWQDACRTAAAFGQALGVAANQVLVASTGVIGQLIPMDKLIQAIPGLIAITSPDGGDLAAQGILTTDLVTKTVALESTGLTPPVRVGGIAKGSGMIHPDMATLLAFITCDAPVDGQLWRDLVKAAVAVSFNQITVDGDTSTNDMLLALANGAAGGEPIQADSPAAATLGAMLREVCIQLAKKVARDGEGATCLIEVQVRGTATDAEARQIARTISGSLLVKSAVFGRDPNWGRIAAAAGRAGVPFHPDDLAIDLGAIPLMRAGQPIPFDREAAKQYLHADPVVIQVQVGNGAGVGCAWGCDLSYDYVRINAEYTT